MIDVTKATTKELVAFYNAENPDAPIKKFADRKTAERRCAALIKQLADRKAAERRSDKPSRAASWADPVVRAKRCKRHFVRVDGVEYNSVRAAFVALGLPLGQHIAFRMELKATGHLNGYRRSWEIFEK